jgi:hypothetical protein
MTSFVNTTKHKNSSLHFIDFCDFSAMYVKSVWLNRRSRMSVNGSRDRLFWINFHFFLWFSTNSSTSKSFDHKKKISYNKSERSKATKKMIESFSFLLLTIVYATNASWVIIKLLKVDRVQHQRLIKLNKTRRTTIET